jgi:chemotaxis protein CheC
MIQLTSLQEDALIELLNIGFGRAAASLSQLTGHRVLLEVPAVSVHPVGEVARTLETVVRSDVASVHQIFSGPVAGDALLILDHAGASMLKELLTNEAALPLAIDASAREVITEVGNILLNACLGTFGNLLKVQVTFSVPQLSLASVGAILESLRVNREGLQYALVIRAGFKLRDAEVQGYLIIVLSVASLDRLIRAVEEWEQNLGERHR